MSRDFVVYCTDDAQAADAERRLASVTTLDGQPLFEVDNRGKDLFVILSWSHDVGTNFVYRVGDQQRSGLREELAFVAIKNGEHDGIGYLVDTGMDARTEPRLPLAEMPERIARACGVEWQPLPATVSAAAREPSLVD